MRTAIFILFNSKKVHPVILTKGERDDYIR